jgi:hypothetical protein
LIAAGNELQGFFYNPNVHPLAEYNLRLESAQKALSHMKIPATLAEGYDVEEYFRAVVYREHNRCAACYHLRMRKTAQLAASGGFDAFTTSLLVSPYQKHDLLREIGQNAGLEYGVEFYYEDFRRGWQQSRKMAREWGLYLQKYCGCIYSEKERFIERAEQQRRKTET